MRQWYCNGNWVQTLRPGQIRTQRQGPDPQFGESLSKRQGLYHRFGSRGPWKGLPHLRPRRKQLIHGDFQVVKGRQRQLVVAVVAALKAPVATVQFKDFQGALLRIH